MGDDTRVEVTRYRDGGWAEVSKRGDKHHGP